MQAKALQGRPLNRFEPWTVIVCVPGTASAAWRDGMHAEELVEALRTVVANLHRLYSLSRRRTWTDGGAMIMNPRFRLRQAWLNLDGRRLPLRRLVFFPQGRVQNVPEPVSSQTDGESKQKDHGSGKNG